MEKLVGGVEVEEKKLTWLIQNFDVVRKHDELIKAQSFEFQAGESIGLSSKWKIYLTCGDEENPGFVGIFLRLIEKPKTKQDYLIAECGFKIKDGFATYVEKKFGTKDWYAVKINTGWGFTSFVKTVGADIPIPLVKSSLVIHCKFRLYAKSPSPKKILAVDVDEMLEKFHVSSKAKAGRDLAHLIYPVSFSEIGIEIHSREGKQFRARKEVLAARSPVFEAMICSEMKDKAEEKLKLTDISSKTLEVLLHYFRTGELLPNWRQREVIIELTNAAAKYELQDLLGFLDTVVGKVCDGANALPLLNLVSKLGLKNAEKELMEFVKRNGQVTKKNSSCSIV